MKRIQSSKKLNYKRKIPQLTAAIEDAYIMKACNSMAMSPKMLTHLTKMCTHPIVGSSEQQATSN